MTWEIVTGIIALFGFAVAIITPITKLNVTITKLSCTIDALEKTIARQDGEIATIKSELNDHDIRIRDLERGDTDGHQK